MNDDVLRLATIGRVLRRRWRLLVALAGIGAVVGVVMALLTGPVYESTSKLLLQGPRKEDEVLTQAQLAMSLVVLDRTVAGLGWDTTGANLRGSVSAEVTSGNVIEIRARAQSPTDAHELARRVTEEYITFSTEIVTNAANATVDVSRKRKASVEQRVQAFNLRISALQGQFAVLNPGDPQGAEERAELEQLRTDRENAFTELDGIDRLLGAADAQATVSRENVRVIEPAVTPSGAVPPTGVQWVAGGALLATVLGAFVVVAVRHADRRLRRRADIAAALGAPVVATVEAPSDPVTQRGGTGSAGRVPDRLRSWISWLAGEVVHRPASNRDEELGHVRYRRVLAQLPVSPSGWARSLVVVVDTDAAASLAAARLTIAAAFDGRAVILVTDGRPVAAAVEKFRAGSRGRLGPITVLAGAARDESRAAAQATVLNVVGVSAAAPTIPNCPDLSGALVVVVAGTATAAELFGIAEACRDAQCPVAGVLVVVNAAEDEVEQPRPLPPLRPERLGYQRRELQSLGVASHGHPTNGQWKQPGDV